MGYCQLPSFEQRLMNVLLVLDAKNVVSRIYMHLFGLLALDQPAEEIDFSAVRKVLDVGCGSAVLSLAAYEKTKGRAEIKAVDKDPFAVRVAQHNAARVGLADRVTIAEGDLFSSDIIGEEERFDLVLASLPQDPGELAGRFIEELPQHLSANGSALVFLPLAKYVSRRELRGWPLTRFKESELEKQMTAKDLGFERLEKVAFFDHSDLYDLYCVYLIRPVVGVVNTLDRVEESPLERSV